MKKKKGPWIITDSKIVYQNPWIKVREDKALKELKDYKEELPILALKEGQFEVINK